MKYAVIRLQGHQYRVCEGEEILVDRLVTGKVEPEVLLMVNEDKITLGKPKVTGAKISLKVLGEEKGEKIEVIKYKAKARYRKHIGFRPSYTRLKVEKISN
jgi:large subunit ribosomal protein L21